MAADRSLTNILQRTAEKNCTLSIVEDKDISDIYSKITKHHEQVVNQEGFLPSMDLQSSLFDVYDSLLKSESQKSNK